MAQMLISAPLRGLLAVYISSKQCLIIACHCCVNLALVLLIFDKAAKGTAFPYAQCGIVMNIKFAECVVCKYRKPN